MTSVPPFVNTSEVEASTKHFETATTLDGGIMDAGDANQTQTDYWIMDAGVSNKTQTDYYSDYGVSFHGNVSNKSTTPEYDHPHYVYDEFIYPGFSFERPVYTYIWGILVIITFLANIIVISVLLRKKMRNPTNMILAGIAISDSLTGLVTLPTYWMVYSRLLPTSDTTPDNTTSHVDYMYESDNHYDDEHYIHLNNNFSEYMYDYGQVLTQDGYLLSTQLCRGFMISKYFLSKSFHTISIWMTLFLGFQRFISVASPFRAQKLFSERNVIATCVVIALLAPVLHVYHLVDEKANSDVGMCQWEIEKECAGGCAYLVIAFFLRHLIPCVLLVIFTVLFVVQLAKSSHRLNRIDSNRGNSAMQHRSSENRRVSLIVTLIVIVFLIPEVPYGGFLLYAVIGKLQHVKFDLETNRAIHLAYEVSLVLSFHANFYIYTFFNKRFRKVLIRGIVYPILTCCDTVSCFGLRALRDKWSRMSFSSGSRRGTRQSETGATRVEMGRLRRSSSSAAKSTTLTEASKFIVNGKSGDEHSESTEKSQCLPQGNLVDIKM